MKRCFYWLLVIVGVGDAVFDNMDELDSDDVRLTVKGRYAERDIVQFVPLNKFLAKNGESIKSQADLAKEVLAEIPGNALHFSIAILNHFKVRKYIDFDRWVK